MSQIVLLFYWTVFILELRSLRAFWSRLRENLCHILKSSQHYNKHWFILFGGRSFIVCHSHNQMFSQHDTTKCFLNIQLILKRLAIVGPLVLPVCFGTCNFILVWFVWSWFYTNCILMDVICWSVHCARLM